MIGGSLDYRCSKKGHLKKTIITRTNQKIVWHRKYQADAQGRGVHKEHNTNFLISEGTGPPVEAGRGGGGKT